MSWNLHDTLPQPGAVRAPMVPPPLAVDEAPGALPSIAAMMQAASAEARWTPTRAEDEALRARGFIPEREWQAWCRVATRGIVPVEEPTP